MKSLVWNMHGLIFETSIWLLAGSTRCSLDCWPLRSTVTLGNTPSQGARSSVHRSTTADSLRKLFRMSHTSPDKAPNAAISECTQYKQMLHSPSWQITPWYICQNRPGPARDCTLTRMMLAVQPRPIRTGSGRIGCRPSKHPPPIYSNFLWK